MFNIFNKKKVNNYKEKSDENTNYNIPRKKIYTSIEELYQREETRENDKKTEENSPEIDCFNINYQLPDIDIIDNNEIKKLIKNNDSGEIIVPLGLEEDNYYYETLESMPNLIVGGTVMSGKSSFIHTLIGTTMLYKKPHETRFLIFDSKKIEYSQYNGIPYMSMPVISDYQQTSFALAKIAKEVDNRLNILQSNNKKSITEYNNSFEDMRKKIPSYIIIVDDYDSIGSEETNDSVSFIAKNGWKVNIYLILVSNHPSTEIISSASKSSIPARLCFKVTSSRDSILFLDNPVASNLAGIGKAAYISRQVGKPKQLNVQILKEEELNRIIEQSKKQETPIYEEKLVVSSDSNEELEKEPIEDSLYNEVLEFVINVQKASPSLIQRKFMIGYNRAAKLIDLLEARGIIGPFNGSKPREVLFKRDENGNIIEK